MDSLVERMDNECMKRRWLHAAKDHFVPHAGNDHHPRLLRHRGLVGVSVLLIAFKSASVLLPLAIAVSTRADDRVAPITPAAIIESGNRTRQDADLAPLMTDERLMRAAQAKAEDMATLGYFAHTSPDGTTALDRIRRSGYPARYAAENLAIHFTNIYEMQRGWLDSPSHRSILLDDRYEDTGTGVAIGRFEGRETTFVVQLFGNIEAPQTSSDLDASAVIATTEPAEYGTGRVLAETFSQERIDPIVRDLMLYAAAFLTALLLIMLAVRYRARHAASVSHAMLVIGLALVLMLA
ncbi:CAP domain-containing protein [Candidatus Uhrbacteria bacterium]|nr:MAG: CAP domain-containing protein [Candidatus Uhrbacteria bacterium]